MAPSQRGWFQALSDRLAAWYYGFPPELSSYTIEAMSIPLEDNVEAVAHLYQPLNVKPITTLLIRSPYGIGGIDAIRYARLFAARKYQVLFASCRGTGPSKGEFYPFRDETIDGHATVSWMKRQTWYTGSFATMGVSYLGYTQWAILSDQPPDMKAAVIFSGLHDMSAFAWGTGALNSGLIAWTDIMTHMLRGEAASLLWTMWSWRQKLPRLMKMAPILATVEAQFQGNIPSWSRDWLTHPSITDSYWEPMQHGDALDRTTIPIMLVTGWYDFLLDQVMEQYARLVKRGQTVALIVGPWTHIECASNTAKESLTWLQEKFVQDSADRLSSKVRLFVTGKREWRDVSIWPPPSENFDLYLSPNSRLLEDAPPANTANSVFKFDPNDPTPSIGSATWVKMDGMRDDDSALVARSDVLAFTTEPIDQDLEVCGKPLVKLYHSTKPQYADILVRICEVDEKCKSHNISETYVRLDADRDQKPLQLNLPDCAHVFRKGMRIRLVVAGGSNPFYVRNLGSGEDSVTGSTLREVWHTIEHHASAASKITLPICKLAD